MRLRPALAGPALLTALALPAALPTAPAAAAARPDLKVASLKPTPSQVAPGGSLSASWTVKNTGTGRARAHTVHVILSADEKVGKGDVRLGAPKAKAVDARGKLKATAKLAVPSSVKPGSYFLIVCADATKKVVEASDKNNCATAKLAIGAQRPSSGDSPKPATTPPSQPAPGNEQLPPAPIPPDQPGDKPGDKPGEKPPVDPGPIPDPEKVAPKLNEDAATSVYDATKFLYSGDSPVQRGVAAGTIDDARVSVIKGKVVDRDGKPLAGAQVTVLDHPEFGYTQTRADGAYDLAINGANLTIAFEKAGFLTVQRALDPSWQDYDVQSDVAMVPVDAKVTEIDPASNAPIQVAESTPSQDADGKRQSLLFFTDGTKATMTLPDGSKKPVEKLEVRVTEYTQGNEGDSAMPGTLPATTGYTYAAEYSIDEALKARATRVDFDRPVLNYLENFTGAPVGGVVPTGYYDRATGEWKAGNNGKVLKVVGKTAGLADLDVTGDGTADTGAALTKLGIDDDERRAVAGRYDIGEELWRVPLDHFTPWDHNWPYGPPPGAKPPKLKEFEWQDPNDPCKAKGSEIGCETQTLGEAIPLVGTDQTLHYTSDRTPGWKVDDKIEIPITPATIPDRLKGVQLEVTIGGKKTEQRWCDPEYPTTGTQTCGNLPTIKPNLTHTLTWDGLDAYDRAVQGRMKATIRVLYVYEFNYYDAPEEFSSSFGQFPSDTEVFDGRYACGNRAGNMESHFFCGIPVGQTITRYIGSWDSREVAGLGGFSLDGHHSFDPGNGVVHKGDGQSLSASAMSKTMTTLAGGNGPRLGSPESEGKAGTDVALDYLGGYDRGPDGSLYALVAFNERGIFRIGTDGKVRRHAGARLDRANNPYEGLVAPVSPDGTPAKDVKLGFEPSNLAVGPDGSVYWSSYSVSSNNYSISRITPEGRIQRVAGNDATDAKWADDQPAPLTRLGTVEAILPAPDGSVYFTERATAYNGWKSRVRKVTAAGLTATVAGGGEDANENEDLGEGEPARDAEFDAPYGMTLGDDGSLYFALPYENVVEKVTPQGRLQRVAGNHTHAYEVPQYGELATSVNIGAPVGVAMGRDGSLYIRHNQSGTPSGTLISRVRTDGRLEHVAGHLRGTCGYSRSPEGEQATRSCIETSDGWISVDGDGKVVFADGRHQIRRIDPPLPGFERDGYAVPSPDGAEVWEFDRDGRHLATRDALTGAPQRTFAYGPHGLSTITDGDGNVTRIERSAAGVAQAVVAPGGQRTELGLDGAGWLESVKNPAGETTRMTYHAGGLLASFKLPGGGKAEFTYDARGRLTKDVSPDGVVTALERTEGDGGARVKVTAGNRATTYHMETLTTGERQRRIVRPGGLTTIAKTLLDGSIERTDPDGTKTTQTSGADPRWGARVSVPESRTVKTPGGKERKSTWTRTATLSDPRNPFSVTSLRVTAPEGSWEYSAGSATDPDDQSMTFRSNRGKQQTTTLDRRGRAIKVKTDAAVDPITVAYDEHGGVKTVTQGDTKQTFTYDAALRLRTRADAAGNTLTYGYDDAGRTTSVTVPDDAAGDSVYRYTYDADGGIKSMRTPEGKVHDFTRTETGREKTYTPAGQGSKYTRDYTASRELESVGLPSGASTAYGYNAEGRQTGETNAESRRGYSYVDGADQFDVISRSLTAGGGAQSIDFGYDGVLPTSMKFAGAAEGDYAYAWNDELLPTEEKLTAGGQSHADALTWDTDRQLTKRGPFAFTRGGPGGALDTITGNGLTVAMAYDGLARIKSRTTKIGSGEIYGQTLTYDQSSRIASITDTTKGAPTPTRTRAYEYDGRGQLRRVKEGGSVVEEYAYDGDGNRVSAKSPATGGVQAATYDVGGQLKSRGGVDYVFDADGFMTKRGSDTFTWSRSGELLTATVGGKQATYAYDALGRRTARTVDGNTQTYLYGDPAQPFRVTAWKDPDGTWTRASYDEHDQLFALRRGEATYAVGSDQVGTPRVVADKDGLVVRRVSYDAFGQPTVEAGAAWSLPIGFAGGLQDPLTGLVRFGMRDYEPASGRFAFRDPSLFAGSPQNLFTYAESNPIMNRDPSGLICGSWSMYGGAGGGVQLCRDNDWDKGKWSICGEFGVGGGGGGEVDVMGGAQDTGHAIVAELTGKVGIVGGTIGGEMSLDCFNVKGGAKVQAGPVKAQIDTSGTPDFGYTSWERVKPGGKIEGKIAWKGCKKF